MNSFIYVEYLIKNIYIWYLQIIHSFSFFMYQYFNYYLLFSEKSTCLLYFMQFEACWFICMLNRILLMRNDFFAASDKQNFVF